jgi:hypothetical protein
MLEPLISLLQWQRDQLARWCNHEWSFSSWYAPTTTRRLEIGLPRIDRRFKVLTRVILTQDYHAGVSYSNASLLFSAGFNVGPTDASRVEFVHSVSIEIPLR